MSNASVGWVCPGCGKRVPGAILSCRCGGRRPAGAAPRREPPWKAVAIGLGAALVLTLTWSLLRSPAEEEAVEPVAAAVEEEAPPSLPVPTEPARFATATADVTRPLEEVIEDVLPAVVSVASSRGTGSGFFVDRYTIVTNFHVTGNDRNVDIKLRDGEVISGRVDRISEAHDLALVSTRHPLIGHDGLPLAPVEEVKVGQDVLVIGSPLGVLESSVSRGIVSAVRPTEVATLIQTDAAINPGNSGGPVIDRQGRVIGIATMKSTQGENLGFAVASDHARELLDGGGSRSSGAGAPRQTPNRLEDLTAAEHEPLLSEIFRNYQATLHRLLQQTARCKDLAPRLHDKSRDELYFEAGKLVLEYVQQRQIYARAGRYIPEWSGMACLQQNEALVVDCYEAIVVYDTAYKSYVSKNARLSRAPRVPRQLPEI